VGGGGGGRGGAGASVLATALALTASRLDRPTMLVDADPYGGGLDLVLGAEKTGGLRWPDLAGTRGRVGGRTLREHVSNCRGRPENPMNPEEVEKKAAWLMEPVLGKQHSDQIIESMRRLETLPNVRELATAMMLP
jgi:CO dehydrogenase nickel-insertion accessory protein CooC1